MKLTPNDTPAAPRRIELRLTGEELDRLRGLVGPDKLAAAMQYLMTWGIDTYPTALLYWANPDNDDPELVGVYRDASGNGRYVIGAVWHGDHFGFHS